MHFCLAVWAADDAGAFALVIRSRDSHLHRLLGARPITASRTL
jgi:hypothetical protein